jgi:hypothetical protein
MQEFKAKFDSLLNEKHNNPAHSELSRSLLKYFDFPAWIDSKLEVKSFEEIVQQRGQITQKSPA